MGSICVFDVVAWNINDSATQVLPSFLTNLAPLEVGNISQSSWNTKPATNF
jgi:hypothetical protein